MQVFENIQNIPQEFNGAVICVGNFDGVHAGHRSLIQKARDMAAVDNAPVGIISFSPHPRRFFKSDLPPFRLTSPAQKQRLLDKEGVDFLAVETFDTALSQMAPEEFVRDILIQKYGISGVLVGSNFRFGHKQKGDSNHLVKLAQQYGVRVEIADIQQLGDQKYSSSQAREYIREGQFDAAGDILGWPWEIDGPVLHGDKRGRTLGYPTANQSLGDYVRPPFGIYAVRATLYQDQLNPPRWYHGVANLGIRPMFKTDEPLLETYIFDFNDDIYGQDLRVQLIQKLRGEQVFASIDELVEQMKRDEKAARQILNERYG